MFEEQVTLCPEKIAVKYYEQELTYNELNTLANQVAVGLIKQGIRKGDFVCVMAHRTPETIVALLGIMKAGAVYVPVDPVWPHERKNMYQKIAVQDFAWEVNRINGTLLV